jgi:hypothetical protein
MRMCYSLGGEVILDVINQNKKRSNSATEAAANLNPKPAEVILVDSIKPEPPVLGIDAAHQTKNSPIRQDTLGIGRIHRLTAGGSSAVHDVCNAHSEAEPISIGDGQDTVVPDVQDKRKLAPASIDATHRFECGCIGRGEFALGH